MSTSIGHLRASNAEEKKQQQQHKTQLQPIRPLGFNCKCSATQAKQQLRPFCLASTPLELPLLLLLLLLLPLGRRRRPNSAMHYSLAPPFRSRV